jgi:hypothetical protein
MKNDIESGNPIKTGQALLRISHSLEISNQLKDVRLGLAEEKAKLNAVQNQIKNISQNLYVILESSFSLPLQKKHPVNEATVYTQAGVDSHCVHGSFTGKRCLMLGRERC